MNGAPLCGPRLCRKRRLPEVRSGRFAATEGRGRLAGTARMRVSTYARYPRYPQPESPWSESVSMTASDPWPRRSTGNGRKPSKPQPERKPPHCPTRRGGAGAKARAADEAAAMRKLRACPLADARVAGFVKRPRVSRPSGSEPKRQGWASAHHLSGRSETQVGALPPAKTGLRPFHCRAGLGFGPGAAKPAGPRTPSLDLPGRAEGFGRKLSCRRQSRASATGLPMVGAGTSVPELPSGEPPGLRP